MEKSSFMRPCVFARGARIHLRKSSGGRRPSMMKLMKKRSPKSAFMISAAPDGYHGAENHSPSRAPANSLNSFPGTSAMYMAATTLLSHWKMEILSMTCRSFSPCVRGRS